MTQRALRREATPVIRSSSTARRNALVESVLLP